MPAIQAQESRPMPSAEELNAVNGSILIEARRLYLYEKASWILEDLVYEKFAGSMDEVGGWIPVFGDGDNVKGLFYDKQKTKVLYEATMNWETGKKSSKVSSRELTAEEIDEINAHNAAVDAVYSLSETPTYPQGCTFNVQAIPIGKDLYRVYWMLGTAQHGIIPFGCDFSYDCDREGNIKEYRRYHKTYIPAQLTMDDDTVVTIFHSHTEICPYMAPTDIALFLLYGYEMSSVKNLIVVSTVFDCYFDFNAKTYSISVGSMEDFRSRTR